MSLGRGSGAGARAGGTARGVSSSRLPSPPTQLTSDITSSSRIGIDRRVGDLRELLLEVAEERAAGARSAPRAACRCPCGPPAPRRRSAIGREEHLQVLARVAERALQRARRLVASSVVGARHASGSVARSSLFSSSHARVRLLRRDLVLDLLVGDDAPARGVDEEHLARLQAPLLDDVAPGRSRARRARSPATTRPLAVTTYFAGRRPLRSSVAPM